MLQVIVCWVVVVGGKQDEKRGKEKQTALL
jgi:hypothetical protein